MTPEMRKRLEALGIQYGSITQEEADAAPIIIHSVPRPAPAKPKKQGKDGAAEASGKKK